ncbi:MAG: hypothetical protein GY832_11495 [Chloroflexi bacterium]|nr:hypothetical protein [Chloroflexota bacterium]
MKKAALLAIITLLICPLLFGQPCEDQEFKPLDNVDPNQIAIDPASGMRLLVEYWKVKAGVPFTLQGRVCDPDSDDILTLVREDTGQQVVQDPNTGIFTIPMEFPGPGMYYLTFALNDGLDARVDRIVRRGTYAFEVVANKPPVLCGGQMTN